jgi:hypothetical protein
MHIPCIPMLWLVFGGKNNAQKQSPWLANPSLANPGYQGLLAMHDSEKL